MDPAFGLDKSGIAGTAEKKDEGKIKVNENLVLTPGKVGYCHDILYGKYIVGRISAKPNSVLIFVSIRDKIILLDHLQETPFNPSIILQIRNFIFIICS